MTPEEKKQLADLEKRVSDLAGEVNTLKRQVEEYRQDFDNLKTNYSLHRHLGTPDDAPPLT